jgi:hypothetical protein
MPRADSLGRVLLIYLAAGVSPREHRIQGVDRERQSRRRIVF